MRQHWTCAILLPAAVLLTTGCATRSWVRELVNKQEVEIDQRFAGVEKRLADDAQQIEGMGSRLQTVRYDDQPRSMVEPADSSASGRLL